jgi:ADP-ribose pyrophosphatase YjhB (NUDIX family)
MARVVRWPVVQRLMMRGVRAVVPRHRVGVALVAVDEVDRILMVKHVFHAYAPWGLPGGWLNYGEAPGQAALRELREETGLSARLGPVLHVSRELDTDAISMAYLAYDVRGEVQLSPEIMDARWFSPDQLPTPLFPFTRAAIGEAVTMQAQQGQAEEGSSA